MQRITADKAAKIAETFSPDGFALDVANAADTDSIVALGRKCFSYNPPTPREIRYSLTKAHGVTFVVKNPSAGTIIAYASYEGHLKRKCLYLNTVAVDAAQQGRGLGKLLYAVGDRLAQAVKANAIYCHVRPDNAVNINMLEKAGFQRLRVEEQYYDDGSIAYVYKKDSREG
jgi:ribosomal-protein-alanine N-acetyltransferase